jgi:hypothetical protein
MTKNFGCAIPDEFQAFSIISGIFTWKGPVFADAVWGLADVGVTGEAVVPTPQTIPIPKARMTISDAPRTRLVFMVHHT